jgi:hypothetical protein
MISRARFCAMPLCTLFLSALAAAVVSTGTASAQDIGGQQAPDPLQAQRTKDVLDENDRNAIRQWLDQRVAVITGQDAVAADQAVRDLASNGARGSAALRQAYTLAVKQAVGRTYKQAELVPAVRMLAVLNMLNDPELASVFVEALSDERPPVRCEAAVGLRNLRARLAAAGSPITAVLSALRDAGIKESSRPTLGAIYQAMNFGELPSPPEPQATIDALLALLGSRAEHYVSGKVRAYGADTAGLRALGAMRSRMGPAQRDQFAAILGKMMRQAVRLYAAAPSNDDGVQLPAGTPREETELLIREAEEQLAALLTPPADQRPKVTDKMEKLEQVNMKIEFNLWGKLLETAVGQKIYLDPAEATTQPVQP